MSCKCKNKNYLHNQPEPDYASTFWYRVYRILLKCRNGSHRFVEVDEDDKDFTNLQPGYYCMDCMKYQETFKEIQKNYPLSKVWGNLGADDNQKVN